MGISIFFFALSFLSSFLLFLIQPMIAKVILPYLGGNSMVWSVCLLFFQSTLFLGYLLAHYFNSNRHRYISVFIHLLLILCALYFIPLNISPSKEQIALTSPSFYILTFLSISIGFPFLILSINAPLLQSWFRDNAREDPYVLYVASNLGSLTTVILYPILVEPNFTIIEQNKIWSGMFACLIFLLIILRVLTFRNIQASQITNEHSFQTSIPKKTILTWFILGFCPSSLLVGVTNFLTSNITPMPLLWMLPLLIYLSTFILAFSNRFKSVNPSLIKLIHIILIPLLLSIFTDAADAAYVFIITLHLVMFALLSFTCHFKLYQLRPESSNLTIFYLILSFAGACGAILNSIIAPYIFSSYFEYPLVILLALFVLENKYRSIAFDKQLLHSILSVGCILATITLLFSLIHKYNNYTVMLEVLLIAFSLFASYVFFRKKYLYPFLLIGILSLNSLYTGDSGEKICQLRNFYGVSIVRNSEKLGLRKFIHGATIHGSQKLSGNKCEALDYYHVSGPAGSFISMLQQQSMKRVAVIGLGTGALAAYGRAGEEWDFFELDPKVAMIAKNYFTLLGCGHADKSEILIGDGRLLIEKKPDKYYSVIIIDAFSSDAIPIHLITQEAFKSYLRLLQSDGFIAVHISNNYLDLKPVLYKISSSLNLSALFWDDTIITKEQSELGKRSSVWAIIGKEDALRKFRDIKQWQALTFPAGRPWTDDFSNIWEAFTSSH
jgi:spermidine synthase